MKNCPVCKVDFDDTFSFCEFDGAPLEKVFNTAQGAPGRKGLAITVRVVGILFVAMAVLLVLGKGSRKKVQVAAIQTQVQQHTPDIATPQGAQDYVATVEEATTTAASEQEAAKRPGVEVYTPETRPSKETNSETKSSVKESDPVATTPEPRPIKPNPSQTRSGERTPITSRSEPIERNPRPEAPRPSSREGATPGNPPRQAIPEESMPPRQANGSVSLQLIRVRSSRTGSGMRYELTFSMRDNGSSRMIRWERLSLVSRSASGITHAEAVPFHQRLGNAGALTFTVAKEMRGRSEADWSGQISCTGIGTDVEGRLVRSSFTARVNP